MEHKYIDADALKEKLKKDYGDIHNAVSVSFFVDFLTSGYIDDMPSADVEPVLHSEWESGENLGGEYLKCKACNALIRPGNFFQWHYCPKCGVEMNGGGEE